MMRKILISSAVLILSAVVCILVCNLMVLNASQGRIYDDVSLIPHNRVGLLLGTSRYSRYGNANLFYLKRINACVELYEAGKIDRILISGDNSRKNYDEPTWMMEDLVARGIPQSAITLDFAGFRTLDSMVRAKEIFGLSQLTVISQPFHNERALYIAHCKNIDAVAFNAEDVSLRHWKLKMTVREWFARVKAVADVVFAKQPHFLGEPIVIE